MNLTSLPNEVGIPLSEFFRVQERFRLSLRSYQGAYTFRLERWVQTEPGGLWTYKASDGISLSPMQAHVLAEGIQQGLWLLSNGASSRLER